MAITIQELPTQQSLRAIDEYPHRTVPYPSIRMDKARRWIHMAAPGSTKVSDEDRIQGLFVGLRTSGHMVRRMITRIHANRRSHLARIVERILYRPSVNPGCFSSLSFFLSLSTDSDTWQCLSETVNNPFWFLVRDLVNNKSLRITPFSAHQWNNQEGGTTCIQTNPLYLQSMLVGVLIVATTGADAPLRNW